MRTLLKPKVYLIARPQIVEEGLEAFLTEQGLRWPTPTDNVKDAERLVEAAGRTCFDDETEILTDQGWKLFCDLNKLERVLTLNPKTNECEWQKPLAYQNYEFDDNLLVCEGRDISFAVTPEHRQWGVFDNCESPSFVRTEEIDGKYFSIQKACSGWSGVIPEQVTMPELCTTYACGVVQKSHSVPAKCFRDGQIISLAKLMTYYATEGCLKSQKNSGQGIVIYGDHVEEVSKLCRDLQLPFSVWTDKRNNVNRVAIGGGRQLREFFEQSCGKHSQNKMLPRWVLDLPRQALEQIWSILCETDGTRYANGREVVITTSLNLAGQCQEILIKIGYAAAVHDEPIASGDGNFAGRNNVYRVSRKQPTPVILNKNVKIVRVPYKGCVFCVTTENGIVLVRRQGLSHFSGNCYMSFGDKAGSKTNFRYIQNLLGVNEDGSFKSGPAHGSVVEHPCWSFLVVGAGRGFSHEQVRHRTGWAYSQISTRYCDFEREESEGTWDPGFCVPPMAQLTKNTAMAFEHRLKQSQQAYCDLLKKIEDDLRENEAFMRTLDAYDEREKSRMLRKAARGAARDILPIATEAIMVMSANARAIWNCIVLRGNEHAEAAIREIYVQIARIMEVEMPSLFRNIRYERCWDGTDVVVMPREKL